VALPDNAIVVRGGTCAGAHLFNGCSAHAAHPGIYGFSVQCDVGKTTEDLARAGQFPNGKIGVSSVGAIRAAGYEVVETQGRGYHATVVVPQDWSEEAATSLAVNFEVESNPAPRR
jgi:hypothetical protein